MAVRTYKDLDIWKKGIEIVSLVYEVTEGFPKEEIYGVSAQMRRSAVSVPSNIAEGFARQHNREYKQFLYIALGSCAELETQMIVSFNRKYVVKRDYENLLELIDHESRMLMNMIKSIDRSLKSYTLRTTINEQRVYVVQGVITPLPSLHQGSAKQPFWGGGRLHNKN
ncbi:MAG: four helix bundle protein [Candidatus Omnitrophica bacterium]|nr:four helix bundle protein [Candidatus Omnitrophota bacterium]